MPKKTPAELRSVFDDADVTFADCVAAFAAPADDIHVAAVRGIHNNDIEIWDETVVHWSGDAGAYVMAWVWVDTPETIDGDTAAMPLLDRHGLPV